MSTINDYDLILDFAHVRALAVGHNPNSGIKFIKYKLDPTLTQRYSEDHMVL